MKKLNLAEIDSYFLDSVDYGVIRRYLKKLPDNSNYILFDCKIVSGIYGDIQGEIYSVCHAKLERGARLSYPLKSGMICDAERNIRLLKETEGWFLIDEEYIQDLDIQILSFIEQEIESFIQEEQYNKQNSSSKEKYEQLKILQNKIKEILSKKSSNIQNDDIEFEDAEY